MDEIFEMDDDDDDGWGDLYDTANLILDCNGRY